MLMVALVMFGFSYWLSFACNNRSLQTDIEAIKKDCQWAFDEVAKEKLRPGGIRGGSYAGQSGDPQEWDKRFNQFVAKGESR